MRLLDHFLTFTGALLAGALTGPFLETFFPSWRHEDARVVSVLVAVVVALLFGVIAAYVGPIEARVMISATIVALIILAFCMLVVRGDVR